MRAWLRAGFAACGAAALLALAGCATPQAEAPTAAGPARPALLGGAPAQQADRVVVVAVNNPLTALPTQAGTTPGLYDQAPRYASGMLARRVLDAVAQEHGLQALAAWPIPLLGLHCATFLIPAGADRDQVLAALARDSRVALAQPLQEFETRGRAANPPAGLAGLPPPKPPAASPETTAPAGPYNDPYLPLQRNLRTLGVLDAHRCSRGQGVTVAVIDTGVDTAHADLQGLQASSANFVDADERQFRLDLHGTEVAGLISARPGNGLGIVGMAPDARLLLYKACWQKPGQGGAVCNSFTLAQALASAIDRGAQVINLSLGGPADPLLNRLLQKALAKGIVVVGATPATGGNSGFPVGMPGVIAVQERADGGPGLQAPGNEVLTLTPGGRYDFGSGSSLAAAQVSAAAALILQRQPGLDGPAIERLLRSNAQRRDGGSPNLCEVLAALETSCPCPVGR